MAIDIQFRGLGEDFLATIREATELTEKFKGAVVSTNDAQTKGAQQVVAAQEQVQTTLQGSVIAVQELGKQSVQQGKVLSAELDKAAQSSLKLDGALTEIERTDLQKLVNQAKAVAVAEGTIIKPLDAQKKARLDQLVQLKGITAEEGKLLGEVIQVTEALQQQSPAIEEGAQSTVNLKTQFLQAKNEATAMILKFGEFSPEAIKATQRAAELKDQIGDFNDRLDALNPDAKFAAFGQVLTSIAGGFTAAQGAAALFGSENEDIQKGILKLQGALAITQGLQAFFSGFSDGLKNIRTLLGLTTTAQVAMTTATEADTVAKGANATATAAATTGIKAFTASLLSSPLAPIVLLIAAVGAAFAVMGDDADDAKEKVDGLFSAFDSFLKLELGQFDQRIAKNQAITEQQLVGIKTAKEQAAITKAAAIEEDRLLQEKIAKIAAFAAAKEKEIALQEKSGNLTKEELGELRDQAEALREEEQAAKRSLEIQRINAGTEQKRLRLQIKEEEEVSARERIEIREKLMEDLLAAEKALNDRIAELELAQADPAQKLAIQRKAAEDEIELQRSNLLEKKALLELEVRIGAEAFKKLSEAQKKARADALISSGDVALSVEQEAQITEAKLRTWDAYFNDRDKLERENAETRLVLIADQNQRELAALELRLKDEADALRLAGATEEEIRTAADRQRAALGATQAQRSRDIEEQIAIARVEAIKEGGNQSAEAQRAAELKILQIKLEARKADLLALGDANDEQTRLTRQNLETAISSLQGAITEVLANRPPVDIFTLLGIKFDSAEQQKAVEDAVGKVIDLVEASLAAQRAEVDAQISATDELIEDRERRSDSLRDQLDQEIELAKLGLANNVDAVRAEIAENDRAAAAEKVRRAKLIEDQKKFARQQLVIEAAQQASALVTTGANLLVGQSLQGIVGVIAGIGFFASVLAAFTAFKARASAINSGSGPSFKDGGSSDGLIEGSRHGSQYGESGIAMIDRNTGKEVGEMEGGEFIVNRNVSVTHREIVEAMNGNDIGKVYSLARAELMGSGAVRLSSERVKEVVETKATYENRVTSVTVVENRALVAKVEELTKEVKAFRRDSAAPKDKVIPVTEGGYMILKANGSKETYRKRKD